MEAWRCSSPAVLCGRNGRSVANVEAWRCSSPAALCGRNGRSVANVEAWRFSSPAALCGRNGRSVAKNTGATKKDARDGSFYVRTFRSCHTRWQGTGRVSLIFLAMDLSLNLASKVAGDGGRVSLIFLANDLSFLPRKVAGDGKWPLNAWRADKANTGYLSRQGGPAISSALRVGLPPCDCGGGGLFRRLGGRRVRC